MMRLAIALIALGSTADLTAAKGWTGVLVDASCRATHAKGKEQSCPVTRDTTNYGIVLDGAVKQYVELGEEGNVKVQAALVEQQKAAGKYPEGTSVRVWVDGKRNGGKLNLQIIAFK